MEHAQLMLRYAILRFVGEVDTISSHELRVKIQGILRVNGRAITQEKDRMGSDGFIDFGGGGVGSQQNSLTAQGQAILTDIDALLSG